MISDAKFIIFMVLKKVSHGNVHMLDRFNDGIHTKPIRYKAILTVLTNNYPIMSKRGRKMDMDETTTTTVVLLPARHFEGRLCLMNVRWSRVDGK